MISLCNNRRFLPLRKCKTNDNYYTERVPWMEASDWPEYMSIFPQLSPRYRNEGFFDYISWNFLWQLMQTVLPVTPGRCLMSLLLVAEVARIPMQARVKRLTAERFAIPAEPLLSMEWIVPSWIAPLRMMRSCPLIRRKVYCGGFLHGSHTVEVRWVGGNLRTTVVLKRGGPDQ
jgi:hypothetical protein